MIKMMNDIRNIHTHTRVRTALHIIIIKLIQCARACICIWTWM